MSTPKQARYDSRGPVPHEVIHAVEFELPPPAERARLLKRMSTLRRRPDIDEATFRHEMKEAGYDVVRVEQVALSAAQIRAQQRK